MSSKNNTKVVFSSTDIKDALITGLKLFVITSVVCAMLFFVDYITKDRISELEMGKISDAITALMGDSDTMSIDKMNDFGEDGIKDVYRILDNTENGSSLLGYCVYASGKGYGGELDLLVGLTSEGKVTGVKVISDSETAGIGKKVLSGGFLEKFSGKSGSVALGNDGINAVSGATITSRGVTGCVNNVLEFFASALKEVDSSEVQE